MTGYRRLAAREVREHHLETTNPVGLVARDLGEPRAAVERVGPCVDCRSLGYEVGVDHWEATCGFESQRLLRWQWPLSGPRVAVGTTPRKPSITPPPKLRA